MHGIDLSYALNPLGGGARDVQHPLPALLAAVHDSGSINGAARRLSLSYRHVWGELRRWEDALGEPLVAWVKGRRATLSPFGLRLLRAERQAQARIAPALDALRGELEQAFASALDGCAGVLPLAASPDDALPRLRRLARREQRLHLDIRYVSGGDALAALNDGRCLLAGFQAPVHAGRDTATARACRPLLSPTRHRLIRLGQRTLGLIVAPGNPLGLAGVADLRRAGLRFVQRAPGACTRRVLEDLLAAHHVRPDAVTVAGPAEPSHDAVAEAVAGGAADAAFGTASAALSRGLGFVPLVPEQCFLVVLQSTLALPPVRLLLELLRSDAWAAEANALPGHAATGSGEVLSLRRALPWWSARRPPA